MVGKRYDYGDGPVHWYVSDVGTLDPALLCYLLLLQGWFLGARA